MPKKKCVTPKPKKGPRHHQTAHEYFAGFDSMPCEKDLKAEEEKYIKTADTLVSRQITLDEALRVACNPVTPAQITEYLTEIAHA